jgi:ABC-type Fe3+/spermidine/putrescine transport system ATPase subunit
MLSVRAVSKTFDGKPVLRSIGLEVSRGEIVCLLGASGCGKSTLLRIIAGLEHADAGEVWLEGARLDAVPVHRRGLGLMFQDFALFPHRDVAGNVGFGLRMLGLPLGEIDTRVREALVQVGLAGFERRRIDALSGGEKQRVALARSLAPRPRLLMLDEPLGSLDRLLREQLSGELREIIKQTGLTAIHVTHDQQEAFAIADRIALMRAGEIEQIGTPQTLFSQPASVYAARFLGHVNLVPGRITGRSGGLLHVETAWGLLRAADVGIGGPDVTLLIHPEAAHAAGSAPGDWSRIAGAATMLPGRGRQSRLRLQRAGAVDLVLEAAHNSATGDMIALDPALIGVLP